jgi:hypothetical protein
MTSPVPSRELSVLACCLLVALPLLASCGREPSRPAPKEADLAAAQANGAHDLGDDRGAVVEGTEFGGASGNEGEVDAQGGDRILPRDPARPEQLEALQRLLEGAAGAEDLELALGRGPALVSDVQAQLAGKPFGRAHIRASEMLGKLSPAADGPLATLSRSNDAEMRRIAVSALAMRPDRPAVLAALRVLKNDPDMKTRVLAQGSLSIREQRTRTEPEELENQVPSEVPPPESSGHK